MDIAILFVILFFGYLLGTFKIKGVALGTSAVLFIALIFGHFGFRLPSILTEFGLILFMYSVGLSVGPRFFRMFRRTGVHSVISAITTAIAGAAGVFIVFYLFKLPFDVVTGLYCGGLTNTPALAAAIQTAETQFTLTSAANISSGYGIAYPFGMVSVVVFNQFLPKILKKSPMQEEEKWQKEMEKMYPSLQATQFRVNNPSIIGKSIQEINPERVYQTNFSRIFRGNDVFVASPTFVLEKGDIVKCVGPRSEKTMMENILGEEVQEMKNDHPSKFLAEARVMESKIIGKRLRQLRFFAQNGVVVTRIKRSGFEFSPMGNATLEMGDVLIMIGATDAIKKVREIVQGVEKKFEFTDFIPYLLGLLLGVGIGFIPIVLPNGLKVTLRASGGVFLVALVLGHFGRIGKWRFYVPNSVHNFSMELGLMIFLAGAGMLAGSRIVPILHEYGWVLFLAGAIVTIITIGISFLVMWKILKMNVFSIMGSLSGGMTNPPALAAANSQSKTNVPTISYAGVMPVALIAKILIAQFLLLFLH